MKVAVCVPGTEKEKTVDLEDSANSLMVIEKLGFFPDAVLVKKNGAIIPMDEPLNDGDKITLIVVSSGG